MDSHWPMDFYLSTTSISLRRMSLCAMPFVRPRFAVLQRFSNEIIIEECGLHPSDNLHSFHDIFVFVLHLGRCFVARSFCGSAVSRLHHPGHHYHTDIKWLVYNKSLHHVLRARVCVCACDAVYILFWILKLSFFFLSRRCSLDSHQLYYAIANSSATTWLCSSFMLCWSRLFRSFRIRLSHVRLLATMLWIVVNFERHSIGPLFVRC